MHQSLQEVLQASNVRTSKHKHAKKIKRSSIQKKGIYYRVNSNMYGHVMYMDSWMTRTVPGCPRCQGWGRVVALPAQGPAHPVLLGVTCSLSLGVLEWTGPPQAGRLELILLGPWGIDPLPLVSAWSAVDYSQRAAAALSSLDQLSAAWCPS